MLLCTRNITVAEWQTDWGMGGEGAKKMLTMLGRFVLFLPILPQVICCMLIYLLYSSLNIKVQWISEYGTGLWN